MPENQSAGVDVKAMREGERRFQEGSQSTYSGEERRNSTFDRRHENNRQYTTFYLDDHYFGIEVLKVQEVLTTQEMTAVPLAPSDIAGLINLRGQIVMALDLRGRLGFPPRGDRKEGMNVIIQTSEEPVSLLVDRIGDVIEVFRDLFEPPPGSLDQALLSVVEGVYKLKNQLLLVLSVEKLIQQDG
jgi:purine-binding chemotaxis protein CheW